MIAYMYILKCNDGSYYVGSTKKNLNQRLMEHQLGMGANFTRKHRPVILLYYEEFDRIEDAFNREQQIKGWNRAKKKALIEENPSVLRDESKCRNESHSSNHSS